MDKLKKLLDLEFLGWLLILLASFGIVSSDWGFDFGVLFIFLNLLCRKYCLKIPFCSEKCKK